MKSSNASKKRGRVSTYFHEFFEKIKENKISFAVYILLYMITIAVIVLTILSENWTGTFTGILALILFLLPAFVEKSFRIELPTTLEIIALLFVFCAEILGEIGGYYTRYPFWDTMLHATSGFIFAAFGFSLVDIFNRNHRIDFHLSPFFLALVACCFSIAVGVAWEFFEFIGDSILHMDMQKDTLLTSFATSVVTNGENTVYLKNIETTTITLADGTVYQFNGHLDVGLHDTMMDLVVDFIGALLFSIIGYFHVRNKKGRLAKQFLPLVENAPDTENPSM